MRSLSFIAAVAMLAVLPADAQMRGGVRGAPAMSRPGFAGHAPVMRAPVTSRGPGFSPAMRWGVPSGQFGGFGCFGFNCFGGPFFPGRFHHHHHFFFQTGFFNSFFGVPFYTYPYYPAMVSDYGSSQYSAQSEQQNAMAREIDQLSFEVQRLREEEAARAYVSPQPAPSALAKPESRPEPARPTVLVFQDKHLQEVENYAIVGQTLWVFSEQRAKKVPLSELDIPATTKLNDERGIEFRVPTR